MIRTLSARHFKSLEKVDLDLPQITVVVGPNGSGKSNLVDLARFLRDIAWNGLEHAIDQRGGIQLVRQYSATRPYVMEMSLHLDENIDGTDCTHSYSIRVSHTKEGIKIDQETFEWTESKYKWQPIRRNRSKNIDPITPDKEALRTRSLVRNAQGELNLDRKPIKTALHSSHSALGTIVGEESPLLVGYPLYQHLSKMKFASVYPNKMRDPSHLVVERGLREDCSNWGTIIKQMRLRKAGQRSMDRIMELMRMVLPDLEQVSVKNVGGYVIPQFLVQHRGKSHFLDPLQLSDGTLRLFGLLLHLYQVPSPSFLAIEEPEQTIHPALLSVLAEAILEASQSTQILITTHSPQVLDLFDVESIRVTTMINGATKISNVRSSQMKTVKEGLMTLSEVMSLDGLRPELD